MLHTCTFIKYMSSCWPFWRWQGWAGQAQRKVHHPELSQIPRDQCEDEYGPVKNNMEEQLKSEVNFKLFWWSNNLHGASWHGCYSSWQMHINITTDKEDIAKSLPMVEPSRSMVMCLARLWLKEQDKLKAYIWPPNELRCQCYKAIMECHWTMDE